jgi:hypothetical protein
MLKLSELVLGGVYVGRGRNFNLGVWNGKGFLGARYKFGYRVDTEYHYDTDPHFGTFSPYVMVATLPESIQLEAGYRMLGSEFLLKNPEATHIDPKVTYYTDNKPLMDYCIEATKTYKGQIEGVSEQIRQEKKEVYEQLKKDGVYDELPPAER